MRKAVFAGKSRLILPQDAFDGPEEPQPLNAAALEEALHAGDEETVQREVRAMFGIAIKRQRPELLRALCHELAETLEQYRKSRRLPKLSEWLAEEGRNDPLRWHHADSIRDWFVSVFQETVRQAKSATDAGYTRKIRQTLETIHAHYAEELTAESLAERVGLSGDRLRHLFKEETGSTVLEYMTQIRMDHAKKLLGTGKYKIYEIALKTGYKSSQYFSQVFRKTTGLSPHDYAEGKGAYEAGDDEN